MCCDSRGSECTRARDGVEKNAKWSFRSLWNVCLAAIEKKNWSDPFFSLVARFVVHFILSSSSSSSPSSWTNAFRIKLKREELKMYKRLAKFESLVAGRVCTASVLLQHTDCMCKSRKYARARYQTLLLLQQHTSKVQRKWVCKCCLRWGEQRRLFFTKKKCHSLCEINYYIREPHNIDRNTCTGQFMQFMCVHVLLGRPAWHNEKWPVAYISCVCVCAVCSAMHTSMSTICTLV